MNIACISTVVPSGKPIDKPDYCVIKFSVGDEPGTLVRALRVFHVSLIRIVQTRYISDSIWEIRLSMWLILVSYVYLFKS